MLKNCSYQTYLYLSKHKNIGNDISETNSVNTVCVYVNGVIQLCFIKMNYVKWDSCVAWSVCEPPRTGIRACLYHFAWIWGTYSSYWVVFPIINAKWGASETEKEWMGGGRGEAEEETGGEGGKLWSGCKINGKNN